MSSNKSLRFTIVVFPGLLFGVLSIFGSQPGEPQESNAPLLRTTTSEVLLDFVVRDKHANIIRDLKPDEVQVFEDGVPQSMRHFEFVDGHSTIGEPSAPSHSVSPADSADIPAATLTVNELRDISLISVVVADLDPRGRELTQNAMRRFVNAGLGSKTYVGVFSLGLGGLRAIQPYTNDGERISAAVVKASSSASLGQLTAVNRKPWLGTQLFAADGESGPPISGPPEGIGPAGIIAELMEAHWVSDAQDVYTDSQRYLTPLYTLIQAQAEIPGRKVVLLFSAGLAVSPDTIELLKAVISAANRSNTSIYALDTRGLTSGSTLANSRQILQAASQASMRQQMSKVGGGDQLVAPDEVLSSEMGESAIHADTRQNLADLAIGTGGQLLPDSLDLLRPLRRAVEDVRTHYELTYSPHNAEIDGAFRKIEVKVSRPAAKVFARSGYYALPILNGQQIYPFEMATMKALNTKPILHSFDFHAVALQFRPGPVRNQLAFVFQVPTHDLSMVKDGQWIKVHVSVTALIKDEHGMIVGKISKDIPYKGLAKEIASLQQGVVNFTTPFLLAPGRYTIDTAAVDRNSMKASVSRTALDVSETPGFAMSDVTLVRRLNRTQGPLNAFDPLQSARGEVTPEIEDVVKPGAEGTVGIYAVAYPPAPADAEVNATIEIRQGGRLIMRSPASVVPLDVNGAAPMLVNVLAAKFKAGHYEAEVMFQYKGQQLAKIVGFTLAGGE